MASYQKYCISTRKKPKNLIYKNHKYNFLSRQERVSMMDVAFRFYPLTKVYYYFYNTTGAIKSH